MEDQIKKLHEKFHQTTKDKTHCLDRDEIISKMKYTIWNKTHWNSGVNKNLIDKIYSREVFQNNKNFPFFSLNNFMIFLGDSILFIGGTSEISGSVFKHEFYTLEEVIKYLTDSECVLEKNGVKTLQFVEKKYKILPLGLSLFDLMYKIPNEDYNFLISYCEEMLSLINTINQNTLLEKNEKQRLIEEERIIKLKVSQSNVLSELDKDGNGEVDVIEGNDFNLLFKKHQNLIKEIDKKHIQEFVKVSSYLKTKKNNIQLIFKSIKDTPNEETLNQYVEILKDDIHSYNLVLFNSLNMIVSLVEDDTITFYEIHEMFDNLNIFDSKHERDVSQKLNNIGDGLKDLMYSIEEMGRNIERQMGELSYVTEQSNQQLENQLQSINSSIDANNLLTGINAYQTYKLRKGE